MALSTSALDPVMLQEEPEPAELSVDMDSTTESTEGADANACSPMALFYSMHGKATDSIVTSITKCFIECMASHSKNS